MFHYKLASGSLAEHMKTALDKLINKDQTGFFKGTFIGGKMTYL